VIVVIAGTSGSGKSTVGALVAERLDWPFADGDLLHPAGNIAKMAGGVPLTDEDRLPWLSAVGQWMDTVLASQGAGLIACSALKRSYRDQLLAPRPAARMAFLRVSRELAARRLAARPGHFFKPGMLGSQFADLELPGPDEAAVTVIPVIGGPERIADEVIRRLKLPVGHHV
jgi:gluconokinase